MQDEPATTTTAPTQNRTKAASRLAAVSVLVPDYDQAIAFYRGTLGFTLLERLLLAQHSFASAARALLPSSRSR